ncbi:hypothetical protein [Streptomyces sp. NPDC005283]|uniref:hypothetical protein n=1 Tax=Streptomyces sp. NPDC005283 TaxID=3156871 RepID=UPI0034523809
MLSGHEAEYINWFLDSGTLGRGARPGIRDAFVSAYAGSEALRVLVLPRPAHQRTARSRWPSIPAGSPGPTMAVGARPVGTALLEQQLRAFADDLVGHVIEDCGHIIPLDRRRALLGAALGGAWRCNGASPRPTNRCSGRSDP